MSRQPSTVLKAFAATATFVAVGKYAYQTATGAHADTLQTVFTVLAVVLLGVCLAGDTARTLRNALAHRKAVRFRKRHGDPAGWDDHEYEAYFALTACQANRRNIQTAA